ncbi:Nif11-like leader peptide family natural product precursor [Synechococcus sp. CS-1330]|nr:Nif11-like leader peptide family natural product precursor [Synechococcus sp. CS-1330]
MHYSSPPQLDALDYFLYRLDTDPELGREFYASTTPEEMLELAEHCDILIDADDFRALLGGGSTEFWVVGGEEGANPIVHLQHVFGA